jgi:hypothetical protein
LYLQCRFYNSNDNLCEAAGNKCDVISHSPVDCERIDKEMWYLIKVLELNMITTRTQIDFFTDILKRKIKEAD